MASSGLPSKAPTPCIASYHVLNCENFKADIYVHREQRPVFQRDSSNVQSRFTRFFIELPQPESESGLLRQEDLSNRLGYLFHGKWLHHKFHTKVYGKRRSVFFAEPCTEDDRRIRSNLADFFEKICSSQLRHCVISNDQVEFIGSETENFKSTQTICLGGNRIAQSL